MTQDQKSSDVLPALPEPPNGTSLDWWMDWEIKYIHDYAREAVALALAAQKAAPAVTIKQRLEELTEQHGSLRAVARVLDFDAGYLSRLASGEKTDPGETLLRRMDLRAITTYERRSAAPSTPPSEPEQAEARDCPNCKHSDSYGIPTLACKAACAPSIDGKGANFEPLNAAHPPTNKTEQAEAPSAVIFNRVRDGVATKHANLTEYGKTLPNGTQLFATLPPASKAESVAPPVQEQKCPACYGAGVIGTPGMPCQFCKLYGLTAQPPQQPEASGAGEPAVIRGVGFRRGGFEMVSVDSKWYTPEQMRAALATKPQAGEQKPVFQWRTKGCADWYDGHPDPEDGGGPYETRTLFMAQPEQDSGKKGGA